MSGKSRYRPGSRTNWRKAKANDQMKEANAFLESFMDEVRTLASQKLMELKTMGFISPITKKKMNDLKKRIQEAREETPR